MNDPPPSDPHKEEDEGYVAAQSGKSLADNPYPRGTIRYEEWRRGWRIRRDTTQPEENDGYLAAEVGKGLSSNPHPRGTIRFEQWRHGWQIKRDELQRAIRLAGRGVKLDPE